MCLLCEIVPLQADTEPRTAPALNVLIIYVDDLGYGDLGSYGHPVLKTPRLDALAAEGARLTQYYAPSALCSPSRAGLLTGRYPYRSGIRSWIPPNAGIYLRDDEHTLAEHLKPHGYRTALIGKWHLNSDLGSAQEPQPKDQGFDHFYGHNAYQVPTNRNPRNIYRGRTLLPPQEGYTADLYVEEAIRWLAKQDASAPFFLMLSMAEPHTTFENPKAFNDRYRQYTKGPIIPIPSGLPEPPWKRLKARGPGEYYANVSYMDAQLGRLFDYLDEADLSPHTLIIFASDNGPVTNRWQAWHEVNAYGETGGFRGRKHYLYEGGIRVPALVRLPGQVPAGTEVDAAITGLDWFPTIAALTGTAGDGNKVLDGDNVTALLQGANSTPRTLFWAMEGRDELEYVLRQGDWKLFLDKAGVPQALYHLGADPYELDNALKRQPARVAAMRAQFETIRQTLPTAEGQRFRES